MNKREYLKLSLFMAITYMVSYITRTNLGAITVEMTNALGWTKSEMSLILTGSFITYGVGQVISGIIGDKLDPSKLITAGLFASSAMNILVPFCTVRALMVSAWCINGFAQSLIWPPMVKLLSNRLDLLYFGRATVWVTVGGNVGTVLVYLTAPLIILLVDWRGVFIMSAAIGVLMGLLWIFFPIKLNASKNNERENATQSPDTVPSVGANKASSSGTKMLFTPVMLCAFVGIIAMGFLRDGVTTWMPSYIYEIYNIDEELSIVSGVLIPVFSIIGAQIYFRVYERAFKSPFTFSVLWFGIGAALSLLVLVFSGKSLVLSVILTALLTMSMHAVNYALITILPGFFKKYGNVSAASGIINSATYLGSALSTYSVAALAEGFGWNVTVVVWAGIAALGGVFCMLAIKGFKAKYM